MEQGTIGVWVAYAAIVAFLVVLFLVIMRTLVMYTLLTLMPVARVLRLIPGLALLLDRLEARMASRARDGRVDG